MDLKLGGCTHHSEGILLPGLYEVILGSSLGHVSRKGLMNLKLSGCTYHSEGIFKGTFGFI